MKNRSSPVKTRILLLSALMSATFVSLASNQAATITVTNANDGGPGSLRQALVDANNGDTIDFDPSVTRGGTIRLFSGELLVNKSVTINGPGPNDLTIFGQGITRVFHVTGGVNVTIAGLTIATGLSRPGQGGGGVGVYNERSTLIVTNCNIYRNQNPLGAGISNDGSGSGGNATLSVLNTTFSENQAAGGADGSVPEIGGAGIYNNGARGGTATLTVFSSTFTRNSVTAFNRQTGKGGAIYNDGSGGTATLKLVNSTVSENRALVGRCSGGGIYSNGGPSRDGRGASLSIRNSTFSNNEAPLAGGVDNRGESTVASSIFDASPVSGLFSAGYNLASDNFGGQLRRRGDRFNTNPLLGPLQNNGGPTFTHALLPGSPAINAGDPNFTPPPDYDQRGCPFARVYDGRIDIGSFEVQPASPPCP